nr:T9SS type A sorting domain-containing protein [Bacteroidota bacterium]
MMDTTCGAVVNDTSVDCGNQNISDLTGIKFFDSLKYLYCNGNQLTSLPTLPDSLISLNCSDNPLTSLPNLPSSLTGLGCGDNQLTSLPTLPNSLLELQCQNNLLTSLPALPNSLIYLICYANQLISLPVLPNSLNYLECSDNQLISLPALPNSLTDLSCAHNQLTTLPALPNSLNFLHCGINQLTSLPTLPNSLTSLYCSYNQLTSLPTLPNFLYDFFCSDNPKLYCLPKLNTVKNFYFINNSFNCLPNYGNVINSNPPLSSLPLCNIFNSDGCKSFWNISGNVYSDTNNNCVSNNTEPKYSNIKLNLYYDGFIQQSTYTNFEGDYSFETDTGLYTIIVDTTNLALTVMCPTTFSDTAYLANNDTLRDNKNFALGCKPGFDVGTSTVVRDSGIFRPANFANVKIFAGDISNHYGLHCAAGTSGAVQVIITGPAAYISTVNGALTPLVNGDTLTYTIADFGLVDFDNDFQIHVQTDTLAQMGDQVCFDVNVTPTIGDNNPANNTLTHCFTVVNSYDPNDKSVSPVSGLSINDKKLTYTIRFQNTGNAPAQHIYVMDTLDAALNASTFELLAYSHQPQVQLIGNILRFNFPNINLPDSVNDEPNSHGYIQFSIKLKDSLALGTIIKNTSYIYFDFNPPVQTNTTSNTIIGTGFNYINSSSDISVYPNPTSNTITIATKNIGNKSIATLYDMQGRELKSQKLNTQQTQINLQGLSAGNYLLKIFDGDILVGVKRVVKMK